MYLSFSSGVKYVVHGDGITHALASMQRFYEVQRERLESCRLHLAESPSVRCVHDRIRRFLGEDWTPQRIAKDGCGLPTVSNTVAELAQIYAGLVRDKDEDWIWESMVRHPDLVGGFNRLDSTILKAGEGTVIAKEGADGYSALPLSILTIRKDSVSS